MKKIIEKACSFEPDKRYGDAAQLRRAVEKCQANNRKKVYKKAGAVFGLIAAGYILAIFSPDGTVIENKRIETAEQSAAEEQIQAEITFREELIEEAVRKELGLSKTDKITASMLENVRKLRIVGKEILDDEDTFWGEGHHVDGKDSSFGSVRGNITDLSDLAQMVNLEELALCNQKIEDISGLKELPLKKLYLSKNMITDFSVLLNLIDMDTLCIMENPAENLSVIGECTGILRLNIQGMNLALFEFAALFLFALTGRISRALGIETAFCAIYGLANYFVLEFRGAPIQPWDVLSISTAASVADNYEYKLNRTAVIVLICFVLLLVLEFFQKKGFPKKNKKARIARVCLALSCGLLCFGYTKMLHSEDIVEQKLHLYNKLFTPTTIQFKNGTVTAFLMELQYISVDKPSGYSAENAKELLASYDTGSQEAAGTSSDNAQKPNIIVIMNEAFSDPSVLGDFTTNEDYMPFVHSLLDGADNTISGHLNVSVKGGNTANTEFEYLTGASMAFLPYGSIPYQQYVKKETPSMASYLSSLGYYTIAMHPYRAAGWDRNLVYPRLGFDEMHFQEFFTDSPLVRKYVSDEGNYEKIIKLYEEKDEDTPLFLFNVTMQNHSSYSDWADYDNFSPDIAVEGSDSKLLPAYLSLIRLSDSAIQNLISYFEAQEEPTIIVFFGDHQPADSVVRPVWKLNGKDDTDLTDEEEALRYKVPFFIWANFNIETEKDLEISANYLAAKTLDAAGLPKSAYDNFLSQLRTEVPVISANHVTLSDGTFTTASKQKDLLYDYQTLQYYLLFD